jgi:hypothetical protein
MVSCDSYVDQEDPLIYCEETEIINPLPKPIHIRLICNSDYVDLSLPAAVKLTAVVELSPPFQVNPCHLEELR